MDAIIFNNPEPINILQITTYRLNFYGSLWMLNLSLKLDPIQITSSTRSKELYYLFERI